MPLLQIEQTASAANWALWHITEDEKSLAKALVEAIPADILHPQKRLEYAAGRLLTKTVLERLRQSFHGIEKDAFGKPLLRNRTEHLSLSHSFPYAAVIIDRHHNPGIDVEQPKAKLLRIASRVLSLNEQADASDDVIKHCVYWCGKETLMKVHGKRDLAFAAQLLINPFKMGQEGHLHGSILANDTTMDIEMEYRLFSGFVLVHTI